MNVTCMSRAKVQQQVRVCSCLGFHDNTCGCVVGCTANSTGLEQTLAGTPTLLPVFDSL